MIQANSSFTDFATERRPLCSHKTRLISLSEFRVIRQQLRPERPLGLVRAHRFVRLLLGGSLPRGRGMDRRTAGMQWGHRAIYEGDNWLGITHLLCV